MTKEEILNKHDSSRKYIEQTCRPELFAAMDEYAKQQVIAFVRHCLENNHLNPDESGSVQLDYNYWHEPHFAYIAGELYSKFIEQQTEDK